MKTNPRGPRILVVDDEADLRTLYELTLLREGYLVDTAESLAQARLQLEAHQYDVMITDMRLDDGLGLSLIQMLHQANRSERCVVITAYGSSENAVQALKLGAFDYLSKPVDLKQFRSVIASALQYESSKTQSAAPENAASDAPAAALARLIGQSACMQQVRDRIVKVAASMAPVLITGESGTGKELAAKAIHANSHRAAGPWVAVNCSAIPEALLEAEFFGAKKGAYTGAQQDREGFFQVARGGTLFLDEIGDLPIAMQSKLLRSIQERCIRPLGSSQEESVDVRIISATHKQLADEVKTGHFRQDLYYRLNVIDLYIPPLRERKQDLAAICEALLQRITQESGHAGMALDPAVLEKIASHPLPGNVRELENMLYRMVALNDVSQLEHAILHPQVRPERRQVTAVQAPTEGQDFVAAQGDLQNYLDNIERNILTQALQQTKFNRTLAAAHLGISLRQMRYRIERLGIAIPPGVEDATDKT